MQNQNILKYHSCFNIKSSNCLKNKSLKEILKHPDKRSNRINLTHTNKKVLFEKSTISLQKDQNSIFIRTITITSGTCKRYEYIPSR